jgi:gluconokinase
VIVVLMGVSGAGKTTIGARLAAALGWPFYEGDDFHPPANVEKIRRGEPLDDADREPWLAALARLVLDLAASGRSAVLACSALKASYRDRLRAPGVVFVWLRGSDDLIRERLLARHDHFMQATLLPTQLAALEPPVDAIVVDVDAAPDVLVARIRAALAV